MESQLQSYLNNIASYFKKIKGHSIGIDIGSNSLKIVELQKRGDKIKLKNYAIVKLKDGFSRQELRKHSGGIVKNVLKEMSINSKKVNIAIPSYSSLITLIEMPGQTEEEIAGEIEYEAAKYIPVNLSEVVFDWQVVESEILINKEIERADSIKREESRKQETEKDSSTGLTKNKVLLVSTMKNVSDEYQKSFDERGLSVGFIEVDCFSIQRSLLKGKRGNYLIIDIGDKVTNIIGIYNGQLLFNRNIDLAGEKLTDLISKSLGVNKARADKVKIKQGFKSDSKAVKENVLKPSVDSIVEYAQKSLEEFEEFKNKKIDKVVLSGGTSEMIGLREYVQDKMKTEVVYGNPWAGVEYPKEIKEKLLSLAPFFGVAMGLALIDLE